MIENCRHLQQQQTTGERIPEELKRTEEDIAREAQCDVHAEEALSKKSSVLILRYQGTPNDNIAFAPFEHQAFHKDPG